MNPETKERARQIQESFRQVLLHDWDPIGVRDPGRAGWVRFLRWRRVPPPRFGGAMGLTGPDRTKLVPAARNLRSLEVTLW